MKYKVSFEIEGSMLADDFRLNKKNIESSLRYNFSTDGIEYWGNRDIDTTISNLEISKIVKEEQ